jgi:hypothetical protein
VAIKGQSSAGVEGEVLTEIVEALTEDQEEVSEEEIDLKIVLMVTKTDGNQGQMMPVSSLACGEDLQGPHLQFEGHLRIMKEKTKMMMMARCKAIKAGMSQDLKDGMTVEVVLTMAQVLVEVVDSTVEMMMELSDATNAMKKVTWRVIAKTKTCAEVQVDVVALAADIIIEIKTVDLDVVISNLLISLDLDSGQKVTVVRGVVEEKVVLREARIRIRIKKVQINLVVGKNRRLLDQEAD